MAKRIIYLSLSLILAVSTGVVEAQVPGSSSSSAGGPKRQLATIIFSGLGGAVLGLSTLSFYGRPQEKLNNIAIGFAIGVIGGTMFTTYQAATRPRSFYSDHFQPQENGRLLAQIEAQPTNFFTYQFEF